MVVEGIKTTRSAYELSQKFNIKMPITEELYKVLYENSNVDEAVPHLMVRDRTHEMENIVADKNIDW